MIASTSHQNNLDIEYSDYNNKAFLKFKNINNNNLNKDFHLTYETTNPYS